MNAHFSRSISAVSHVIVLESTYLLVSYTVHEALYMFCCEPSKSGMFSHQNAPSAIRVSLKVTFDTSCALTTPSITASLAILLVWQGPIDPS